MLIKSFKVNNFCKKKTFFISLNHIIFILISIVYFKHLSIHLNHLSYFKNKNVLFIVYFLYEKNYVNI